MKVAVKSVVFAVVLELVNPAGIVVAVDPFANCQRIVFVVLLTPFAHRPATAVLLDKGTNIVAPEELPEFHVNVFGTAALATGIVIKVETGTNKLAIRTDTKRLAVLILHEVLEVKSLISEKKSSSVSDMGTNSMTNSQVHVLRWRKRAGIFSRFPNSRT